MMRGRAARRALHAALCGCAALLAPFAVLAAELPVPEGWRVQPAGEDRWRVVPPEGAEDFAVTLGAQESVDGEVADWFSRRVRQEVAAAGATLSQAPTHDPASGLYQAVAVLGSGQDQQLRHFGGIATADGRHARLSIVRASSSPQLRDNMRSAGRMLGELALAMRDNPAGSGTKAPEPTLSADAAPQPGTRGWKPIASDGRGLDPDDIEALMYEGRGVTTAMGYQYRENVLLLLRDGRVYTDLEIPPADLDVTASQTHEPDEWSRWRRRGGTIQIRTDDGEWKDRDLLAVRPLPQGSAWNAAWAHKAAYASGGFGGSVFTERLALAADGRYERLSSRLSSTGAMQGSAGFSGGAASREDSSGRQSSVLGSNSNDSGTVGATSRSRRGGNGAFSGRYRVDGYTLELVSDAGQRERLLAFYPFDDDDKAYIGGSTYSADAR